MSFRRSLLPAQLSSGLLGQASHAGRLGDGIRSRRPAARFYDNPSDRMRRKPPKTFGKRPGLDIKLNTEDLSQSLQLTRLRRGQMLLQGLDPIFADTRQLGQAFNAQIACESEVCERVARIEQIFIDLQSHRQRTASIR